MLRTRKSIKLSRKLDQQTTEAAVCPFCSTVEIQTAIKQTELFYIVRNRVPYDFFDGVPVRDHLMLIPKRHIITVAQMNDAEKVEYVTLLGSYESSDYAVYSRAVEGKTRSVEHVHTHLMKIPGKRVSWQLYLSKPYLLLSGKQKQA